MHFKMVNFILCEFNLNQKRKLYKKKATVATLLSAKATCLNCFRARKITMDDEGHFIMINGLIEQGDITRTVMEMNNMIYSFTLKNRPRINICEL